VCTNSMLPPILQVCAMMAYLLLIHSVGTFDKLAETGILVTVVFIFSSTKWASRFGYCIRTSLRYVDMVSFYFQVM
jgi:hypothetical protein